MEWFATLLANLLGGPFAKAAVDAYKAKLDSGNNAEKIAADLAAQQAQVDLARERLEQETARITESSWLVSPRWIIEMAAAVYVTKTWVYDAAFHQGVTDQLTPQMGESLALVLAFMFGHKTIITAVNAFKR